jgi:hypothetical protein
VTHRPELRDLVAVPRGTPRLPASDVEGWDLAGCRRTLRLATPGRWTLLLFLGSHCDGCLPFWSVPRTPGSCGLQHKDEAVVVTRAPGEEVPEALAQLIGVPMGGDAAAGCGTLVMSRSAWDTYRVLAPPFFVLLDGVAVVTEGVAWSVEQVAADVARVRGPRTAEAGRRPRVER